MSLLADQIKAQTEKSSMEVFSQFRKIFNEMSTMISNTQDNQIEMYGKIEKLQKDLDAIKLLLSKK
jgi:Txe/YoeB family toxin of Txe-Axe toxin-antitoxin module